MRCQALRSVPIKKVDDVLLRVIAGCVICSKNRAKPQGGLCDKCSIIIKAFNRYAESNIPVRYWTLEMNKDFVGDETLKEYYDKIANDIPGVYTSGTNACFAGMFGLGKTMICTNILKRAVEKGYEALYVTLLDVISAVTSGDRYNARSELISVDFLVIDEFDPRYMATENASDFFGRIVEDIFRTRSQNCLPTFMCTNSPDVSNAFSGVIQQSIKSLMHDMETIMVLGDDFRKKGSNA